MFEVDVTKKTSKDVVLEIEAITLTEVVVKSDGSKILLDLGNEEF